MFVECVMHDTNFPFHFFFQIPELRHSNDTQKHIHSGVYILKPSREYITSISPAVITCNSPLTTTFQETMNFISSHHNKTDSHSWCYSDDIEYIGCATVCIQGLDAVVGSFWLSQIICTVTIEEL